MSKIDIEAGTKPLVSISEKLEESGIGLIVLTAENHQKPWINFEAGAISNRFDKEKSRVIPILVDIEDPYAVTGPISQYQFSILRKKGGLDEAGISSVVSSIAQVCSADPDVVQQRFRWSWEELKQDLESAKERAGQQPAPPKVDRDDLLRRLINSVRDLDSKVNRLMTDKRPSSVVRTESATRADRNNIPIDKFLKHLGIDHFTIRLEAEGGTLIIEQDVSSNVAKNLEELLEKQFPEINRIVFKKSSFGLLEEKVVSE